MRKCITTIAVILMGTFNLGFCADATIQVKAGDSFTISRPENAGSTGYLWSQTIDNESIVTFTSKKFEPPMQAMPGAPGTAQFTFQAMNAGDTTITLKLCRPWEKEKAPAKTYTVDVVVK